MKRAEQTAMVLGLAALVAGMSFCCCGAATIRVPLDQPTIGEALAASSLWDTVLVAQGTYTGPLNRDLSAYGRVVVSESGPQVTVMDCEEEGRAFSFGSHWSEAAEIVGFTVRNARPPFGDHDPGGGMELGGEVTVRDCVFEDCYGGTYGGGISCHEYALIIDCAFYRCTAVYGGGLSMGGWSKVENCLFVDNRAYEKGGGIRAAGLPTDGGEAVVQGCTLVGNLASAGGGIYCSRARVRAYHNVIAFNDGGGAVVCSDSGDDYEFWENIVYGNEDGDSLCGTYYDNMFTDPLFCDLGWDGGGTQDLTVCSNSPCVPSNNEWGAQAGALGEGCGECDSPVDMTSWGKLKSLYRVR